MNTVRETNYFTFHLQLNNISRDQQTQGKELGREKRNEKVELWQLSSAIQGRAAGQAESGHFRSRGTVFEVLLIKLPESHNQREGSIITLGLSHLSWLSLGKSEVLLFWLMTEDLTTCSHLYITLLQIAHTASTRSQPRQTGSDTGPVVPQAPVGPDLTSSVASPGLKLGFGPGPAVLPWALLSGWPVCPWCDHQ